MNTQKVLWQLFCAIALGITTGVLVGYRTNYFVGVLTGTLLAFLTADWRHVRDTSCRLGRELKGGVLTALKKLKQGFTLSRLKLYRGMIIFAGLNRDMIIFAGIMLLLFLTVITSGCLGLTLFKWVTGYPTEFTAMGDPVGMVVAAVFAFGFGLPSSLLLLLFMVFDLLIKWNKALCYSEHRRTDMPILQIGMARWNILMNTPFNLGKSVAERVPYAGCPMLMQLFLLIACLLLLSPALIVLAGIGVVALAFLVPLLVLDLVLTILLALATSQNTIAGYCTAVGIGVWFWSYPEQQTTVVGFLRLFAFATVGGLAGAGIYRIKEWLISRDLSPKMEATGIA